MAARDEFTGESVFRPVTDLFRRTAPGIARVTLDGADGRRETLAVTGEHPLFVEGKGWTPARSLRPGDRVSSRAADRPLTVAEIAHDSTPTQVYNLEIAQDHSYFAGEAGAWAHNMRFGPLSPTDLYKLVDKAGNLMKWGITSRGLKQRYSQKWLERNGCEIKPVDEGTRQDMLALERDLVRRNPGPMNRERWRGPR